MFFFLLFFLFFFFFFFSSRRRHTRWPRDWSSDVCSSDLVILIIIMLIIPLPGWLLSILILCNITLALIVILVSMNTQEALQFSIFPSLLLLLTLFRLGLNVSTTRSILSERSE